MVEQENEKVEQKTEDVVRQYQIVERKKWEQRYVYACKCTSLIIVHQCSSHPYIFFNQDRTSITFVGFKVTKNGDLIDPVQSGRVLIQSIMSQELYKGLKAQGVDFEEDYSEWSKDIMIQKISTVMGLEGSYDPDPTYVLTIDNLIKILAIQMRFRCFNH